MTFYTAHDPRFERFVMFNAPLKKLATGFDWTEGPVWFGDADCLLFSDIPNNRILRWTRESGITTYRAPSNYANGHTRDGLGRLVSCEHGARRVTRTEHDGTITVIADSYEGKPLNSPNDVVVKSDGSIWFSDPHYGIMTNYEGYAATAQQPLSVYRVDESGIRRVATPGINAPNGLCFSPDETRLYVADTGRMYTDDVQNVRAYTVTGDGTLSGGDVFCKVPVGASDGIRCDTDGNFWTSAGDGVYCYAPDGTLLGHIPVPEIVSNICFGGHAKHQLFITATTSLYSITLNRQGAQKP
ncbi:SMP-30/gluconolactonase/LRE family protein [Oceaniglobus ichthyenteri]|uniref:SMP-30/gluconolactonase/LRE family protein n=1 Tax=Oceaniglobus ichthyenteri TaxID=2136177 RepID=UPI000D39E426|nr:SMP-30/gluconolactonase/LRE family protein [Oceaniglobus ichthyenteri]